MTSLDDQPVYGSLAAATMPAAAPSDALRSSRQTLLLQLRLTAQFHSTLDPMAIIRILAKELAEHLAISYVAYSHGSLKLAMQLGRPENHRCSYQLEQDTVQLGEIWFGRNRAFTNEELEQLELFLTCMVAALGNALRFEAATKAAIHDELTGCGNRTALELCASREIAQARRNDSPTAMLVIDCDHFKAINDKFGHAAGDYVLRQTGQVLRDCCRDSDGLFRFGGEEFVMLLGQTTAAAAGTVAERVRNAVERMVINYDGQAIAVTASIGIAQFESGDGLDSWFKRADEALYQAKAEGRNRVVQAGRRIA